MKHCNVNKNPATVAKTNNDCGIFVGSWPGFSLDLDSYLARFAQISSGQKQQSTIHETLPNVTPFDELLGQWLGRCLRSQRGT
jgi:hypothetical protein